MSENGREKWMRERRMSIAEGRCEFADVGDYLRDPGDPSKPFCRGRFGFPSPISQKCPTAFARRSHALGCETCLLREECYRGTYGCDLDSDKLKRWKTIWEEVPE